MHFHVVSKYLEDLGELEKVVLNDVRTDFLKYAKLCEVVPDI